MVESDNARLLALETSFANQQKRIATLENEVRLLALDRTNMMARIADLEKPRDYLATARELGTLEPKE